MSCIAILIFIPKFRELYQFNIKMSQSEIMMYKLLMPKYIWSGIKISLSRLSGKWSDGAFQITIGINADQPAVWQVHIPHWGPLDKVPLWTMGNKDSPDSYPGLNSNRY